MFERTLYNRFVIRLTLKFNLKAGEQRMRNKADQSHNILREQLKSNQDLVHITKQLKKILRIQGQSSDLMCSLLQSISDGKMITLSNNLAGELKGITWRLVDASAMIGCNGIFWGANGAFNYKLTWRQVQKYDIICN